MDLLRARACRLAAMALAYYGLSRLGLVFMDHTSWVTAVWPASGVALGVFALSSPRRWPELVGAVGVANLVAQIGVRGMDALSVELAVANALEPVLAVTVLSLVMGHGHGGGRITLMRTRGVLALVAAATVGNGLSALVGAGAIAAAQGLPLDDTWLQWWLSDGAGMMVLAPIVLAVAENPSCLPRLRQLEPAAAMVLVIGASVALFVSHVGSSSPIVGFPFMLFPLLVWAALRMSARVVAAMLLAVALIAAWGTTRGNGPFIVATLSPAHRILVLQVYISVAALMTLAVAALTAERRAATQRARDEREQFDAVLRAATEDAIIAADTSGLITVFNDGAQRMLGYSAEEMVGRATPAKFHDPDEIAELARTLGLPPTPEVFVGQARRGIPERRDCTLIRKDGSRLTVSMTITAIHNADGVVTGFIGISHDVTERRQTERDLATAERRARDLYEFAPVGMGLTDLESKRFIDVNPALCAITGYTREQLLAANPATLDHPDDRERGMELRRALHAGEIDHYQIDKRYLHASGSPIDVSVYVTLIRDSQDKPLHLIGQVLDITERKRFENQLRHLADHDPLTGLFNRRRFEQELSEHIERRPERGPAGATMILDIDNFKQVNDTLGHGVGDELIVQVAQILSANLRSTDVLARLGGDEFAILLPRIGRDEARRLAAKLVDVVRREATVMSGELPRTITISLGATTLRHGDSTTSEALMVEADLAMYDAKAAGRNAYAFYDAEQRAPSRTKAQINWLDRLERAISTGGFILEAQPILDLRADRITQHELLIRMLDDHGQTIPPAAFLDVAERYEMIGRIDQWVAHQAIDLLSRAHSRGVPCRLEINISGQSIGSTQLLDAITSDLRATSIDPTDLIFEVTETAAVADIPAAQRFAQALRDLGCRFALDDFGAGFGSFYYLKHLPFDYLKIDGEFVARCRQDRTDRLVIEALVQIAQGLGKDTIAEFVPDAETQLLLRRLGIDYAQGYHVGMPVPLAQALPELFDAAPPAVGAAPPAVGAAHATASGV